MRILICLFSIVFPLLLTSQSDKYDRAGIELRFHIKNSDAEAMVPLLLKANEEIEENIRDAGGKLRMRIDSFYSVEIPAKNVLRFIADQSIEQADFSLATGRLLNDSMRSNNNIDSLIYLPPDYPSSHTGKGVIMGIIDSGIDFSHPDFKDSSGNTRILNIWDQTAPTIPSRAPQPYSYGVEWDSSDINAGICTHEDPPANFGHGTMVAGAAAGNGLSTDSYKGAAPAADLIVVASDFNRANWLQSVAEAVHYIFSKADQLQKPCVINISAGTYAGSHDGKDIAAQIIDQLIKDKSGRAVVAAAGNAGQKKFHLDYQVSSDTSFTWFEYESNLFSSGGIFFELFADTSDFNNVRFGIGADDLGNGLNSRGHTSFNSISNSLYQLNEDTLRNHLGQQIAIINTYAEENDGVYKLQVAVLPDSTTLHYRFSTTGSGYFDVWSSNELIGSSDMLSENLPDVSVFPSMLNYRYPDTLQSMVSSFTCLPSVVTVANYINRNSYPSISGTTKMGGTAGEISPNSSLGPTRNALQKPDIAAAGDVMISAGKLALIQQLIQNEPSKISADSMHMRNGGTSMASPGVAGILALYLEKCPNASYSEMKSALISNARKDAFTPNSFSVKWGHGKADAFQSLKSTNVPVSISTSQLEYCQGDTAILNANGNFIFYRWNNGDTSSTVYVDSSGIYSVITKNQSACSSISDTLAIAFLASPNKPYLSLQADTIYSSYKGKHQWYFNSNEIPGETSDKLKWTNFGQYYAKAIDTSTSCSTNSDTISTSITSVKEEQKLFFQLFPNPTECSSVMLSGVEGEYHISLHSAEGKLQFEKEVVLSLQPYRLNLCPIEEGFYIFTLMGNGINYSHKLIIQ